MFLNCDAYVMLFFFKTGSWESKKKCQNYLFARIACLPYDSGVAYKTCNMWVVDKTYNSLNYIIFLNIFWVIIFY